MSYALRRLTSAISRSKCVVVFINQLRAKISTGYAPGPQETTTGGRALKFYGSVRVEVKRGKSITKGDSALGHELWMKVVKNKQAPPFRTAHTSLVYGKGIPKGMAVVDMAIDLNVLKRRGSWLAYKGETIGQGKDQVASFLEENGDLMKEITNEVMEKVSEDLGLSIGVQADETQEDNEKIHPEDIDVEEGVLELDLDEN
jgi:recombination protein RecA